MEWTVELSKRRINVWWGNNCDARAAAEETLKREKEFVKKNITTPVYFFDSGWMRIRERKTSLATALVIN